MKIAGPGSLGTKKLENETCLGVRDLLVRVDAVTSRQYVCCDAQHSPETGHESVASVEI